MSIAIQVSAQEERALTREGNKHFDKGLYTDAEASYKKALEKKNNFNEATFNLGDAIYQQKRYDESSKQFLLSSKLLTDTTQRAAAYHNLGNSYLSDKKYEQAVEAYRSALKLRPFDKDTKYNLAYANAMLKQQNQNNKDNKGKDNKSQDKKDQQKNQGQNNQDNKDQDKDGQSDPKNQKDKQPPKKNGNRQELSKEQAEKLLQALKAEEQKAQEKMQKKMAKPAETKVQKDW